MEPSVRERLVYSLLVNKKGVLVRKPLKPVSWREYWLVLEAHRRLGEPRAGSLGLIL